MYILFGLVITVEPVTQCTYLICYNGRVSVSYLHIAIVLNGRALSNIRLGQAAVWLFIYSDSCICCSTSEAHILSD